MINHILNGFSDEMEKIAGFLDLFKMFRKFKNLKKVQPPNSSLNENAKRMAKQWRKSIEEANKANEHKKILESIIGKKNLVEFESKIKSGNLHLGNIDDFLMKKIEKPSKQISTFKKPKGFGNA